MENDNLRHIKRISGKFRRLCTLLIALIPILTLLFWLFFNALPPGFSSELHVEIIRPLPPATLALAFLVSLIPVSITVYGIITLRRLFTLYEQGIIFTSANVQCFRHFGYTLIYWAISKIPFLALSSIVLTYNNPAGERTLVIGFGSSELATIIIGAVVLTISWVMNEAVKLEDEQAHTV